MAELKISTWIIVIMVFSVCMITSAAWIGDINTKYPDSQINTSWNQSFDKISQIQNMSESLKNKMQAGENSRWQVLGTAAAVVTGTWDAVMMGFSSFSLLDTMTQDLSNNLGFELPSWLIPLIIVIIVISLCLTIISAWLNRSV